jgi:hypothetical protein
VTGSTYYDDRCDRSNFLITGVWSQGVHPETTSIFPSLDSEYTQSFMKAYEIHDGVMINVNIYLTRREPRTAIQTVAAPNTMWVDIEDLCPT